MVGVGKNYAPLLPWVRWEYYLPEETLLEAAVQELFCASASIDKRVTKPSENLPLTKVSAEKGALPKAQLKISINEVSSYEAALKRPSVPLEAVIPIHEYTEILKNIGIATADDLAKAKPETVHLKIKDYVKKQKLDAEILSAKDIARVTNEVNQMLTKSAK